MASCNHLPSLVSLVWGVKPTIFRAFWGYRGILCIINWHVIWGCTTNCPKVTIWTWTGKIMIHKIDFSNLGKDQYWLIVIAGYTCWLIGGHKLTHGLGILTDKPVYSEVSLKHFETMGWHEGYPCFEFLLLTNLNQNCFVKFSVTQENTSNERRFLVASFNECTVTSPYIILYSHNQCWGCAW